MFSRATVMALTGLALAACATSNVPPTPTKTPGPEPTPAVVYPSLEALEAVALNPVDVGPSYEIDPAFTGPLTVELLVNGSSAETGDFLRGLENIYGYQSAFIRTSSVDELAAVRDWVVVFSTGSDASRFVGLHPTITQNEQGFQMLPAPALGEESASFVATTSAAGAVPLDRHDVVIRRRNVVAVLFVVTAAGLGDVGEIERHAQTLDARLAELEAASS